MTLDRLDDQDTLRARARRTVLAAVAVSAAVLAPLVDELLLGNAISHGRMDAAWVFFAGAWAAITAALTATLAMHRALGSATPAAVVGFSVLGGVLYPVALFSPGFLAGLPSGDWMRLLAMPFVVVLLGGFFSAPAGLGFGFVFLSGIARIHGDLAQPTQETPARAWRAAALICASGALASLLLAVILAGSYCQLIFFVLLPALGIEAGEGTDLAWTRFVLLPAPLALASIAAFARAVWLERELTRTIALLRRGEHPRWILGASAAEGSREHVVPLRDRDRSTNARLVHQRDAQAPYRDGVAVTLLAPDT